LHEQNVTSPITDLMNWDKCMTHKSYGELRVKHHLICMHSSFFKLHFESAIPGMQRMPEADIRN